MSKKSKRQVRKVATLSTPVASPAVSAPSKPSGMNTDYSRVLRDLKRIGILAGSFVAVLIVISFFLH